jgi:hypothetical protein
LKGAEEKFLSDMQSDRAELAEQRLADNGQIVFTESDESDDGQEYYQMLRDKDKEKNEIDSGSDGKCEEEEVKEP